MRTNVREYFIIFIRQIIAVYAFSFFSNLIITAVFLIAGFADPEMRGAGSSFIDYTGTVRAVAATNLQYSMIPFALMYAAMILFQRGRFTYGDEREEWRARGRKYALVNLAAYFLLALPVLIWFAGVDVQALYDRSLMLSLYEKGYGNFSIEPYWILNSFAPFAAPFRWFKAYLPALLWNLTVIPAMSSLLYLIPKRKAEAQN